MLAKLYSSLNKNFLKVKANSLCITSYLWWIQVLGRILMSVIKIYLFKLVILTCAIMLQYKVGHFSKDYTVICANYQLFSYSDTMKDLTTSAHLMTNLANNSWRDVSVQREWFCSIRPRTSVSLPVRTHLLLFAE